MDKKEMAKILIEIAGEENLIKYYTVKEMDKTIIENL